MVQKSNNIELEVIQQLLRQDCHVRGLAKTLEQSHSTILRKLENLARQNVIDYRKEGRNKVFFIKDNIVSRNHILQAEIHKLNTLLGKYQDLVIILEQIAKKADENLIIVFGSYAKFRARSDSDIDIYIRTEDRNVRKAVESINSKIKVKTGPFDASSALIREIIKDHVIVRGFEEFYEKKRFPEQAEE